MKADPRQVIFFRADGDNKTGLGHVIRISALANAIKNDYRCVVATRCRIPGVLEDLEKVFDEVILLPDTDYNSEAVQLSREIAKDSLVVLDGYGFEPAYQQILNEQGHSFFFIDDIHNFPIYSKIIFNHSGGVTPADYETSPATQFYLGPHYALLRPAFLEAAKSRRRRTDNRNCFVCFGGADPVNRTLGILKELYRKDKGYFDQVHVVTGSAYAHTDELQKFAKKHENISLHQSLSAEDLVTVIRGCAYAICSPSTVVYEYMSVGGVVYLEQIADNQKDVIRFMTESGLAFSFNEMEKVDEDKKQASLDKQAYYFDGGSGERFQKIFKQYFEADKFKIRRAEPGDLDICFQWANDPEVRLQSYNQDTILMEGHVRWFHGKLSDRDSFFYIVESGGKPIGQIRFQVNRDEAVLGYLVDKTVRNKGLGTWIIGKGIEQFISDYRKPVRIIGYVKNSNIASQRSFERLAFKKEQSKNVPGSVKYTMEYGY